MNIEAVKNQVQEEANKAKGNITEIAKYVINELLTSQENADKIANKPLSKAMEYVTKHAKERATGNMAMIHENEVYGWIREFYEISDLTVVKKEESIPSFLDFL